MNNQAFVISNDPPEVAAAKSILRNGNSRLRRMVDEYVQDYNNVWANKSATPDKIIAALGTQGQAVFTKAAATAQYLVAMGAVDQTGKPTIPTTSPVDATGKCVWNITDNADGSVTLTKAS